MFVGRVRGGGFLEGVGLPGAFRDDAGTGSGRLKINKKGCCQFIANTKVFLNNISKYETSK